MLSAAWPSGSASLPSPCQSASSRIQCWRGRGSRMAVRSAARSAVQPRALPQDRFFNRELSRLDFDSRVLTMAEDKSRPLAERLRFLANVSDSLDDFFQVRVA